LRRPVTFLAFFLGIISAGGVRAGAQITAYQQSNLVSDIAGTAEHLDRKLVNPWGIALKPGGPFWIANNGSGYSTIYNSSGAIDFPLEVIIPAPITTSASTPTGVIYNPFVNAGDFPVAGLGSQFLFATEDGTVSGWYVDASGDFPVASVIAIDNSNAGAVYTSLAILAPACCREFLAVANFHSGLIEPYTVSFARLAPPGSFTDPQLPAGYAPFGMQVIGNRVFVTYALQDQAKRDPVTGAGNGIVNIFDLEGNFVRRFASNGPLDAPWGVTQATSNFGQFSNAILIGNFGDGHINAFNPDSGEFLGPLQDFLHNPITNSSLWGLTFGPAGTAGSDTLYFTAGLAGNAHGLFGTIATSAAGAPDFAVTPAVSSATITAGQSANFTLTVTPNGGFSGTVAFSCMGPAGVTCTFNPASIEGTNAGSTTLTVDTSGLVAASDRTLSMPMAATLLFGFALFGCFLSDTLERKRLRPTTIRRLVLLCTVELLLVCAACGGYNQKSNGGSGGTVPVVVTASSGLLTHVANINLTLR
jgi:uncharacterized protein (TIGR03118 family)